jgi:hypothetical protein
MQLQIDNPQGGQYAGKDLVGMHAAGLDILSVQSSSPRLYRGS